MCGYRYICLCDILLNFTSSLALYRVSSLSFLEQFLHSILCYQDISILLHVAEIHLFSLPNNIPLGEYTTNF